MRKRVFALALPILGLLLMGATLRELPATPAGPAAPALPAPSQLLHGEILHQSDALAAPTVLEVAGDRLILADDYADRSVRVLRRSDGAIERSFGTKGRGPREFESVLSVDVIDPSGRILLHDPMLQRVTWVDLERDFEGDRWVADRSVRLNAPAVLLTLAWTPEGLVGLGTFTEGRLAHLSADGRFQRATGSPPVAPGEVTRRTWTRVYQTRLESHPDRTRFAVASRFSDRLEIHDREGTEVALAERPYGFGPEDLREEDAGAVRFGYIDVAATEDRIFALFSGRTRAEGGANFGGLVHVFDWDGRLVDVWELDSRLIALAVDPAGETLYGVRHDPLPAVLTYTLD